MWKWREHKDSFCVYHESNPEFAVVVCDADSDAILIADFLNAVKLSASALQQTVWLARS